MENKEKSEDIFILQVLISNLSFDKSIYQSKLIDFDQILPIIKIKIIDGPEILMPHRTAGITPNSGAVDVNKNQVIFNFNKGKSCIFTTRVNHNRPSMKLVLSLENGNSFPFPKIGESEIQEKVFDPSSLSIQNFLKGNIIIFDQTKSAIALVGILVTLQSIGLLSKTEKFISHDSRKVTSEFKEVYKPENLNKLKRVDNKICLPASGASFEGSQRSFSSNSTGFEGPQKSLKKSSNSSLYNRNDKIEKVSSSSNSSIMDYSDEFCSSNSTTSSENTKGTDYSVRKNKREKIKATRSTKKIFSNKKPTGWLRSAPVYKGNILDIPPLVPTTRSIFLNLAKKNPYLEDQLKNEIERKLKEKLKIIDRKYQNQINQIKNKNKVRSYRNPTPSYLKGIKLQNKETQSEDMVQKYHKEDKETIVGESLRENYSHFNPDFGSDLLLLSDDSQDYQSSVPNDYEPSIHDETSEQIGKLKSNGSSKEFYSVESSPGRKSKLENGYSDNSGEHPKIKAEDQSFSDNFQEKVNKIKSTNYRKPSLAETSQLNEQSNHINESIGKSQNDEKTQLPRQNTKTTTSIYPETSEDVNLKRKSSDANSINNINESISDISARIAALLVPRNLETPSIHTDSVSSYEPSNTTDLSNLSSL